MAHSSRSSRSQKKINWFTALVNVVRGLFVAQVQLERRQGKLHVVLQKSKGGKAAAQRAQGSHAKSGVAKPLPAMGVDAAQLERMQEALTQVLDQHAGARKVLRHLGYLEHVLGRKGARCFLELPVDALKPALLQLRSVMGQQPSQGLTEVHACLVVTVVDRDMPDDSSDSGRLSVFNVDDKIQVREVSHADFVNADRAWAQSEETAS
ncbi:hypothetical protein [Aquabacterium sp. CECT 9606]|uniref:hypothetical protein n=1 Tax=Aquabacterium sp. CECT 9606 TaxID=2845822 RepID=UPI001E423734|nr:hypothetical protein [Aquabacterium sp. CECT 9606]CAH0348827.1 hypothetical protein AQB9606_00759 [Aquabacterium sp. CECT 9606]